MKAWITAPALVVALLPGAAVVWLSYSAGGYFAGTTAFAAVGAAAVVAALALTVRRPLAGLSITGLVAVFGLAVLAVWTLMSSGWSHADARAQIEYDRVLLYLLVLVACLLPVGTTAHLRTTARGVVLAFTAVAVGALIVGTHPDIGATAVTNGGRLAWPTTYWNALGLQCGLGLLLAFHFAADPHEPKLVRLCASAVTPVLLAVLLLTQSRGGLFALGAGLLVYFVAAGSLSTVLAGLALLPGGLVVVLAVVERPELTAIDASPTLVATEGQSLIDLIVVATAVTLLVFVVLAAMQDRWLPAWTRRSPPARVRAGVALAAAAVIIGVGLAADAPSRISEAFNAPHTEVQGPRRLASLSNNGRVDQWRVAWRTFKAHPLRGTGAGTYADEWIRLRPRSSAIYDAHSLYLEVLGELGVVGFLALALALVALGVGLARRSRQRDGAMGAAALAVFVAWAVAAAVDWHWEMPAVTLGVIAVAGSALARPPARADYAERGRPSRLRVAGALLTLVLCIGLVAGPWRVARSQVALDGAVRSFQRGDCVRVTTDAREALAELSTRPEPWELQGYCRLRSGDKRGAIAAVNRAIALDPLSARLYYARALIVTAAGRNPRSALREALRRDPVGLDLQRFLTALRDTPRRHWVEVAQSAPAPLR